MENSTKEQTRGTPSASLSRRAIVATPWVMSGEIPFLLDRSPCLMIGGFPSHPDSTCLTTDLCLPFPPLPPIPASWADVGRSPNSFLEKASRDVEDEAAEVGVCGLVNMGNTCYMNSALQCLQNIPSLAEHYFNSQLLETGPPQESGDRDATCRSHLSHTFSTLLRKMWSGRFTAVHPKTFKSTLGLLVPQFNGSRQQDCQEFLSVLLDSLHEDNNNHKSSQSNRDSAVSKTFQGSLQNEIVCCKCGHVSSKTDPFVFLSVPLPHAFETQLVLIWMPACTGGEQREAIQVLVTVLNDACVRDVKCEAVRVVGGGDGLQERLVLAEVKGCSITRILADTVPLKNMDWEQNTLYCFETAPLQQTQQMETTPTDLQTSNSTHSLGDPPNGPISEGGGDAQGPKHFLPNGIPGNKHGREEAMEVEEAMPAKVLKSEGMESAAVSEGGAPVISAITSEGGAPVINAAVSNVDNPVISAVVMEWHSCSICLEEMIDSELVSHVVCGGIVCPSCLQASVQHYSNEDTGLMPCPLCSRVVKPADAFTPLASKQEQSVISLLQMTVLFRSQDESGEPSLCGHPTVCNLPSNGTRIHDTVAKLLPQTATPLPWEVAFTDSKGRYCSRCAYSAKCRGCVLDRDNPTLLKPGDHLAVTFQQLPSDISSQAGSNTVHHSMSLKRRTQLTLDECLSAFSNLEELGADNPWYCSQCECNQLAVRTLSVSSLPDTLIIHLKRFVYHGTGTKLDTLVSFPLELCPQAVCGQHAATTPLRLTACVCHFGTLHSGHYTAYGLHPKTQQWYYYNDESVQMSTPSAGDSGSVYVLFYQQKSACSFPPTPTSYDDSSEMKHLESLLRIFKPHSTASANLPAGGTQLKRATSESNLSAVVIREDHPSLISALDLTPQSSAQQPSPWQSTHRSSNPNLPL